MNFTYEHYMSMLSLLEAAHESMDQTKAVLEQILNVMLSAVDLHEPATSSTTEYVQLQLFDPSGY
jgi:hypothetical protein